MLPDAKKLHCTNDGHIRTLSSGSLHTVWPGQHTGGLKLPLPAEKRSLSGGMAHYTLCQQDAFTFRHVARGLSSGWLACYWVLLNVQHESSTKRAQLRMLGVLWVLVHVCAVPEG